VSSLLPGSLVLGAGVGVGVSGETGKGEVLSEEGDCNLQLFSSLFWGPEEFEYGSVFWLFFVSNE
jgi:hypothetical protein